MPQPERAFSLHRDPMRGYQMFIEFLLGSVREIVLDTRIERAVIWSWISGEFQVTRVLSPHA